LIQPSDHERGETRFPNQLWAASWDQLLDVDHPSGGKVGVEERGHQRRRRGVLHAADHAVDEHLVVVVVRVRAFEPRRQPRQDAPGRLKQVAGRSGVEIPRHPHVHRDRVGTQEVAVELPGDDRDHRRGMGPFQLPCRYRAAGPTPLGGP